MQAITPLNHACHDMACHEHKLWLIMRWLPVELPAETATRSSVSPRTMHLSSPRLTNIIRITASRKDSYSQRIYGISTLWRNILTKSRHNVQFQGLQLHLASSAFVVVVSCFLMVIIAYTIRKVDTNTSGIKKTIHLILSIQTRSYDHNPSPSCTYHYHHKYT